MKTNLVFELFIFFQILNLFILYKEWNVFSKDCSKKILAGRLFIFLLPSLVCLSLILKPLE